jgi:hypothetical protein
MRASASVLLSGLILSVLLGCQPAAAPADPPPAQPTAAPVSAQISPPPVEERATAEYTLRITRAPIELEHRSLLRAVEAQLAQIRDEFVGQALAAREEGFPFEQPWSLELSVEPVLQSDELVQLELTGYEFTGGAHGMPLLASYTYLPKSSSLMTIEDWFADAAVWEVLSAAAVDALVAQLGDVLGDAPEGAALEWIQTGASADPANFAHYRPLLDGDGRIRAFEFTFQPYQVGPYAIGTPKVEIPLALYAAHLAPEHRGLFAN